MVVQLGGVHAFEWSFPQLYYSRWLNSQYSIFAGLTGSSFPLGHEYLAGRHLSFTLQFSDPAMQPALYSNQTTADCRFTIRVSSFTATADKGTICAGDTILLKASGRDDYIWSLGNTNLASNVNTLLVYPTTSTNYSVTIKENTCQGTSVLNIPVTVNALPSTTVTNSNEITCTNTQAILHVRGGSRYVWDAIPGITQLTVSDPVVTPLIPTTYYVRVTDRNGCTRKDSVFVAVNFQPDKQQYSMASAFTPNNDGNNDCFGLKYWGQVTALQFEIFNRWGEPVFSATNAASCWDGYYKGVLQPNGGYMYQVKAVTTCGTVYRKGVVMLLK